MNMQLIILNTDSFSVQEEVENIQVCFNTERF